MRTRFWIEFEFLPTFTKAGTEGWLSLVWLNAIQHRPSPSIPRFSLGILPLRKGAGEYDAIQ